MPKPHPRHLNPREQTCQSRSSSAVATASRCIKLRILGRISNTDRDHYNHPMPQVSSNLNNPGLPRLNQLLAASDSPPLEPETENKFAIYLALLQKWNTRTNLTAIRDEEGILKRHFLESILCAGLLPGNIVSLLDFGSGAGFPGIPIALIRKNLTVTLAESQNKKAAFLREAVRILNLNSTVHSGRAEVLNDKFDCVTLRAVDQMELAVLSATSLLTKSGWLAILTTQAEAQKIKDVIDNATGQSSHEASFAWQPLVPLPRDTDRTLLLAQRRPA